MSSYCQKCTTCFGLYNHRQVPLFIKILRSQSFTTFRLGFRFCWNVLDETFVLNVYNIDDILQYVALVFKSALHCITLSTDPLFIR